jgi:hypothetical protein
MPEYVVMSPCYELLRYGHDTIKKQTADAHAIGKQSKFVFGPVDLIDPTQPPTPDNYRFEACQAEVADVVVFVDPKDRIVEDTETLWGRRRKRVTRNNEE